MSSLALRLPPLCHKKKNPLTSGEWVLRKFLSYCRCDITRQMCRTGRTNNNSCLSTSASGAALPWVSNSTGRIGCRSILADSDFFGPPPVPRSRDESPAALTRLRRAGVPDRRAFRLAGWEPGSPTGALFAWRGGSRAPLRACFSPCGTSPHVFHWGEHRALLPHPSE